MAVKTLAQYEAELETVQTKLTAAYDEMIIDVRAGDKGQTRVDPTKRIEFLERREADLITIVSMMDGTGKTIEAVRVGIDRQSVTANRDNY